MENKDYIAIVTAESRDTGQPRTFRYPLSEAGELLNNLVLSGHHNISEVRISDSN